MNFTLDEDHLVLQASAAAFLDGTVDLAPLLRPGADRDDAGRDRLWAGIVEMGWTALAVPEAYGGLGLSCLDLIMVVGEMGRTLAPSPFFGTLAGTWAILAGGSAARKRDLLARVAGGVLRLALAVADGDGNSDGPDRDAWAQADGVGWRLNGAKSFVVDAAGADVIVAAADVDGARRWFLVERGAPGLFLERLAWRDPTREVCAVRFAATPARLLEGDTHDVWPFVRDRLHLVLAAESAAGAKAALDQAVEYAKGRVAFGRPIGAFQALKHQLAEIAGQVECSAVAVQYAAWALSQDDPRASLAAAMAQSHASETYREATHRNIQVHGAIGFTWEMRNHLYYKRARCNAELLGAPARQRECVVRILEAEAAA
jgi:alkylation response protein AidB-like acyl-CoA dehydrogenase